MGLRQAAGFAFICVQVVIGADYHMQTRRAGLELGELSARDYAGIVRARMTRARAERTAAAQSGAGGGQDVPVPAAAAGNQAASAGGEPGQVCVRRGTVLDCN